MISVKKILETLLVLMFFFVLGCKKKESPSIPIEFDVATLSVKEGGPLQPLKLNLASPFTTDKVVKIKVGGTAVYGADKDFTLSPVPDSNNELTVTIPANTTEFAFADLTVIADGIPDSEEIEMTFASLTDEIVPGSSNQTMDINIVDELLVNFKDNSLIINEGQQGLAVKLELEKALGTNDQIKILISPSIGTTIGSGQDIMLDPTPIGDTIIVKGSGTELTFYVSSFLDLLNESNESVTLSIIGTPDGFVPGKNKTVSIGITDNTLGSGLVAEYLFSGNAFDTSGKGNNGQVHGPTLTASRVGEPNSAYLFDGSVQNIQVPNNQGVNFAINQNFAVSLWASPNSTQNDLGASLNNIIRKWVGDAQGYPFTIGYLNSLGATPQSFYGARYDGSACYHIPTATSSTVTSSYHHILFQKSGSVLYLYVDGILTSQTSDLTNCETTNTSDLFIGCEGGTNLRCFTGAIDDIRIYNRVLTVGEITLLYGL